MVRDLNNLIFNFFCKKCCFLIHLVVSFSSLNVIFWFPTVKSKTPTPAAGRNKKFKPQHNPKSTTADPDGPLRGIDDAGGPAYANVPKGAKSTKQAKTMKQMDSIAKNIGSANNTEDLVMGGDADDIGEFMI